jgi:hypothetical protein
MAGAAGQNCDHLGFIMDPNLPDVAQHWKETGFNPFLRGRAEHIVGGYRTVKIPSASVLTLNTVPIQIVPAPAAGKILIPTLMIASLVYGAATYAVNASGASLKYGTAGAGTSTGFTLSQAFLQSSSGTNVQVVNQSSAATYLPATTDYATPLTLIAASADPTTGDSDLYVRVYFLTLTVPFTLNVAP